VVPWAHPSPQPQLHLDQFSRFFAGLTSVTDDRPHYSVTIDHIFERNTAVQPNNAHIITRVSFRQVSVAECQMSI